MPRKRSGYCRVTSGYWSVTGWRKRVRSVTPIARPTAPASCAASPPQAPPAPPQPPRSRPEPAAEEEQRAEKARAQHVGVLAQLDERELHPAVLDAEAGHQLRFSLEDVEGHTVLGGGGRDAEE